LSWHCTEWKTWIYFPFPAGKYPVFLATFVEEAVFSPSYVLGNFIRNQVGLEAWSHIQILYSVPLVFISVSVLVPCYFLFLWLCSISWTLVLRYLQPCSILLSIAILNLLYFQLNFRVDFSIPVINIIGILVGIA
jgi:hypothetical protein